jgi:hypothetical protein
LAPFVELGLSLYFGAMAWYAVANGILATLPFILLFQCGFLYSGALSLCQGIGGRWPSFREQEA